MAGGVVVGGAYVIFGISAFGAALFTVPILSHFLPLGFVLPMCVLLDMAAAFALGTRFSRARSSPLRPPDSAIIAAHSAFP